MADQEHGFESPEGHRLCVNNCGFLGSPATQNMCPKCYRDSVEPTRQTAPSASPASSSKPCDEKDVPSPVPGGSLAPLHAEAGREVPEEASAERRCATCRRRTGLTGFRCRCGVTFCGAHRYPERHGCGFDYKAVGRGAIAKENPLVRAEKLHYRI